MLIRRKGAIINVSSTAANYPHARSVVYGGSKAFLSHFSMGLRSDLHGTGVRVTAVEPGRTTTEIVAETDYLQMAADDVAEAMFAIAGLPPHINCEQAGAHARQPVPGRLPDRPPVRQPAFSRLGHACR
jgi:serine 3-dehydrogenase (NADP+)